MQTLERQVPPLRIDEQQIGQRVAGFHAIRSHRVSSSRIGISAFVRGRSTTASRMESHGDAGQIQVTETTYELIKDDFIVESTGVRSVKGKDDMRVRHIVGRAAGGRHSVFPGQGEAR